MFRPKRFLGEWNKDAFVPFSGGPRACIGRGCVYDLPISARNVLQYLTFRFFEATGLAMLTLFIQRYKVEPHPKFAGESFEQLKEKYSQGHVKITLTWAVLYYSNRISVLIPH